MHCLVYVDPESRGDWALSLGGQLAPGLGSVVLLATDEDVAKHPGLLSDARERFAAAARVEEKRSPGPAEHAILREVASGSYDLLIVPPAGRNALQRMLKGSRVATVVRSVRASVLVARRPPARIERILVAVSGGAASQAVVRAGLEMEKALAARASFFHVASEVALPYEPHAGHAGKAPEDPAAHVRALLAPHGRELVVREGLVVEEVIAEVENGAYDLLVAGALAEPAPGGWAKDDATERMLLGCPTSMLIVRG
jgi:nucleotide-binding universal stress UspA family protein